METNNFPVNNYPTAPDGEGYFIESKSDEELGFLTRIYENGNKTKTMTLPLSGRRAVVRELLGKDVKDIARFMDSDQTRYQLAALTVATTLDGQKQPVEVFESLKMKDFSRLVAACDALNFQ